MKIRFTKEFMKASAVLLFVFVAGAGTGYVSGRKHAQYMFLKDERTLFTRGVHSRGGAYGRRFMHWLERDLNLDPRQRVKVNGALERHYERIRNIRRQMRPQLNAIMREVRQDVRSFLDNNQKVSFDRLVESFEERRRKRRGRFRGRHPGASAVPLERQ